MLKEIKSETVRGTILDRPNFTECRPKTQTLPYLVLTDTPYSYDGVSTGREESVKCWVQLQGIDPVSVVLLHLVSNNIGNLTDTSRLAVHEVIKRDDKI